MPTNYPAGKDTFKKPVSGTTPGVSSDMHGNSGVVHSELHIDMADAMKAMQDRVGVTNDTDPTTLDYLVKHPVIDGGTF